MAERRFNVILDAKMNVDQVHDAVGNLQKALDKVRAPADIGLILKQNLGELIKETERLKTLSLNGVGSMKDFDQLAKSGDKVVQLYSQVARQIEKLGGLSNHQIKNLFPQEVEKNIRAAVKAMELYESSIKDSANQQKQLKKQVTEVSKKIESLQNKIGNVKGRKTVSNSSFEKMAQDAERAEKEFIEATEAAKKLEEQVYAKKKALTIDKGRDESAANKSSTYRKMVAELEEAKRKAEEAGQAFERLKEKKNNAFTQTKKDELLAQYGTQLKEAQAVLQNLQVQLDNLKVKDAGSFQTLVLTLNQIKGIKLDATTATIDQVSQAIANLTQQELQRFKTGLNGAEVGSSELKEALNLLGQSMQGLGSQARQADAALGEVDMLKSRVKYFFSLTNSIYLFRRALTSALNTVKELDAAMTETAVVTDFSIGDMWNKLPEYSKQATQLGTSIKSLYEATTLYYQQGLNTNQAMGIGIETMKMARIAGMDASAATEAMTAALRGFNMEINETSATRINDVYSQLAAISASNTEQIATAMSKTASIAANANMEFETTAALLAQIIETTQEAPETAGTAMKTIIARFTEVKQLFSEGMLTGEDEEGEEININKIDAALKSVGISLKDFLNGTKGIDDIFLELASKWDTLDLATQRYIATTAAGSSQQSRFIAMMSNYDRTMELVTAANNSAGASQKQFDKTLESMEAKLQKLKNAWDQFAMGLANNEILKGGVDLLTELLKTINNLTEFISGGNGIIKSVLNLGIALMGLKTGGAVLSGILASISHASAGKGFNLAANIKTSFGNTFAGLKNFKPKVPKIEFDTAGLTAYQASLTSLQGTYQQVAVARAQYDSIAVAGNAQQAAAIALDDAEIAAEQQLAVTSAQLAAATGLENAEAREAVLFNSQGLSLDLSVAAAKAGVTAAELKEAAVKQLGTAATDAAVAAKMREILAEKGIYVAINAGIVDRLEEIAMTKLGIVSTLASAAAQWLETKGVKAKTAAMIASLGAYIAIAGAVWVAIKAISYLNEQYKNSTPEGKLKKAQERTKAASEAAEEAAESYNNLKNSLEEIDSKKTDLDQLIKGTQECRDTVLDLNQQVMKLIDLYPKLGRFVSSENGMLSIDYDKEILQNGQVATVDSVIEDYQWRAYEAEQAHVAAQIGETQAEIVKLLSDSVLTGKFKGTSWEIPGLGSEIAKELAKKVALGEFTTESEVDEWLAEKGQSTPIGYSLYELGELGHKILNLEQSIDAFTDTIIASAIAMEGFGDTVGEQMVQQLDQDMLRANYNTQYQKLLEEEYAEITDDMKDRYAELKGYTYNKGKFWKKDEDGEEKEVPITDEEIRTQLASIDASKELTKSLDKLSEVISGKSVTQREFIENVFSNDGAGITNATLDKYATYDEKTKSYFFD